MFSEKKEYENYRKNEVFDIEKVNHQRSVCSSILAGVLFSGFEIDENEKKLAFDVNRMMQPARSRDIERLERIEAKRWDTK